MNGESCTALNIIACDNVEALVKAYSYFGASYKLSCADFRILLGHKGNQERAKLFHKFTNETIIYFSYTEEEDFINDLPELDIIECR
jgi:hypothetical protein